MSQTLVNRSVDLSLTGVSGKFLTRATSYIVQDDAGKKGEEIEKWKGQRGKRKGRQRERQKRKRREGNNSEKEQFIAPVSLG